MAATMIATDRTPWYDARPAYSIGASFPTPRSISRNCSGYSRARGISFVTNRSCREAGCFFMNYIGEDQVIAVRDRTGKINVLLNSCSHRGNSVCRAEQGRTNSFLCSYHGWNYDLDGRLVAIPGQEAFYRNDVDKTKWGLGKAAQVANYRGFVFATLDPTAPPLEDYLGWVGRLGIDMLASNGDLEVSRRHAQESPEVQLEARGRQSVRLVSREDFARLGAAHRLCAGRSDGADESDGDPRRIRSRHRRTGYHASGTRRIRGAHEERRRRTEVVRHDGGAPARSARAADARAGRNRSFGHPNIFPNLWITQFNQVCLRVPRGPFETELWWFTLLPKEMPEDQRRFASIWPITCSVRRVCSNRTTARTGATRRAVRRARLRSGCR